MLNCLYINNKPFSSGTKLKVNYCKYRVVKRIKSKFKRNSLITTLSTIKFTANHRSLCDQDLINITNNILNLKQVTDFECIILQNKKDNQYLIQLNYTNKVYKNRIVENGEIVYWNVKTNKRIKKYKYRKHLKHHIILNIGSEIPNSYTYTRVQNVNDLETLVKQTKEITMMINNYLNENTYIDGYTWRKQKFKGNLKVKDTWGNISKLYQRINRKKIIHNQVLSNYLLSNYDNINDLISEKIDVNSNLFLKLKESLIITERKLRFNP